MTYEINELKLYLNALVIKNVRIKNIKIYIYVVFCSFLTIFHLCDCYSKGYLTIDENTLKFFSLIQEFFLQLR